MQQRAGGDVDLISTGQASAAVADIAASKGLYDKLSPGPGRPTSQVTDHQRARIHRAMIEVVAQQGYSEVKVRDVVRLAGVSTRAFYELFDGKEDCFLRTHELLVRRAARGLIVSQAGEHGWRRRLNQVQAALEHVLVREADAARLVTVDAYAAGPDALEQARRSQATIEAMVGEAFGRAPDGIALPPLMIEGLVTGIARILRARFRDGREQELPRLVGQLGDWALCYPAKSAAELPELDSRSASTKLVSRTRSIPLGSADDDRAIILASVAKLTAADGYDSLTIPRIRAKAGVSRRKFNTHFEGVEDCFLAAMEQRGDEALAHAGQAQIAGRTWAGGIYRAMAVLSDRVAGDPILTSVCLADDFPPGSNGPRSRKRLMVAVTDQLIDSIPIEDHPSDLVKEISCGAIWELFHRHVVRSSSQQRPRIAATLSYMALAPIVGPSAAVAAIRREQMV